MLQPPASPAVVGGEQPVEVVLLTGLPGSGRSWLLQALLRSLVAEGCRSPDGDGADQKLTLAGVAVCVHHHARAFGLETTELDVAAAPCVHYSEAYDFGSGCLCCSPDGDVARLLVELAARRVQLGLTHLLIETTGAADPRPFIELFGRESDGPPAFVLAAVLCTVDLCRAPLMLPDEATGPSGVGARGAAQLRAADVLVLLKAEELDVASAAVEDPKDRALTLLARANATAVSDTKLPTAGVLGPFSASGQVSYSQLRDVGAGHRVARGGAAMGWNPAPLPAPMPSPFMSFGPPGAAGGFGGRGGHDASCETACIVLPRGVAVHLDPALAALQLLLDSGEAFRVQGYISFWPREVAQASKAAAFPELSSRWGLPMVVVDGVFRSRLEVRAVEDVAASNAAAESADAAGRPWQDTADHTAAADRGASKVFICGRGLDEQAVRAQFSSFAVPLGRGFRGPVCNLEVAWPMAAQALARLDETASARVASGGVATRLAGDGAAPSAPSAGRRDAEAARSAAEHFGRRLCAALAPDTDGAKPAQPEQLPEVVAHLPPASRERSIEVALRWDGSLVTARRALPCGVQGEVADTSEPLELLVIGTEVYCAAPDRSGPLDGATPPAT